jgi:hypothetical protein
VGGGSVHPVDVIDVGSGPDGFLTLLKGAAVALA